MRLIAIALVLFSVKLFGQQPAIFGGNLQPGKHKVGFKTLSVYDTSRPPIADLDGEGLKPAPGRQIQINVWYPATNTPGSPLSLLDYARLLATDLDFDRPDAKRLAAAEEELLRNAVELGGPEEKIRSKLPELLALTGRAYAKAKPAPGRFPLLVYPEYRAPMTNSAMGEYLASHGIVVATTQLRGTTDMTLDVGVSGLQTIGSDILFVMQQMHLQPNVDADRTGVMGVGIAASGAMTAVFQDPRINTLISLDGGLPTEFEDRMLRRLPLYDISSVTLPMLVIHAPHPSVNVSLMNTYKYSAQQRVNFPQMSEFHFQNYGLLEPLVPGIIGKKVGDTVTGFAVAADHVRSHLECVFRTGGCGPPREHSLAQVTTASATPRQPSVREMKLILREGGPAAFQAEYERRRKNDATPFTQEKLQLLSNYANYFLKDTDLSLQLGIAQIRAEIYPESARAQFTYGSTAARAGKRDIARPALEKALALLDRDPDPALDNATRTRLRNAANQALAAK